MSSEVSQRTGLVRTEREELQGNPPLQEEGIFPKLQVLQPGNSIGKDGKLIDIEPTESKWNPADA